METPWTVLLATLAGSVARWFMLRVDYRQYPSYPQGFAIHLSLGLIAAFLGALAAPAVLAREFAAASFLALAATQFREVRKIEREALLHLEGTELVRRGAAYIEGIARVFEARNYVTMLTGLLSSLALELLRPTPAVGVGVAAVSAVAVVLTAGRSGRGLRVGDLCRIRPARVEFHGPLLSVEGAVLLNVGRQEAREIWSRQAAAFVLEPKGPAAAATLGSPGQRQAILHDLVARVGVRLDVDEPEFTPVARRRAKDGAVVVVLIPMLASQQLMVDTIARTPVLESSVRTVGRQAVDGWSPARLGPGQPG